MTDALHVLWLIWAMGSLILVPVSFIISLALDATGVKDETKGVVVLVFILSLVSVCAAIAVSPG